jgi:membrane protein YqaA with SNARE-associated domain
MPSWLDFGSGLASVFTDLPLLGLFLYSFLAATLLPGGSEVALFAYLANKPTALWPALALVTLGNTLGGLTSYACGRLLTHSDLLRKLERFRSTAHYVSLQERGAPLLLLAWVPLVGDLLCLAAGWLKLNWASCTLFMALGKFTRYWLVAQGALLL